MAKYILFLTAAFALLLFSGAAFASSCAASAYSKTCASCSFDANGKVDASCKNGYQSSGVSCVATSHPIASAAYQQGKCPQIDACADELRSCTAQYSSGNDSADCKEGSVSVCYSASDSCVDRAAADCGEKPPECKAPAGLILLVVGSVFLFGYARRG